MYQYYTMLTDHVHLHVDKERVGLKQAASSEVEQHPGSSRSQEEGEICTEAFSNRAETAVLENVLQLCSIWDIIIECMECL